MEITLDVIFAVVTFVVTMLIGVITKNSLVPSEYIPLQNFVIGVLAALIATYFNLFTSIPSAIILCLFTSMAGGGTYDLFTSGKKKENPDLPQGYDEDSQDFSFTDNQDLDEIEEYEQGE